MRTPLHQHAAAHGGVLLAREARRLMFTWEDLRRIVADEKWSRICRGAYALPGMTVTPTLQARAVQRLRPSLVVSHELAALILQLDARESPPLTFTPADGLRRNVPTGGRLYRWHLPASDIIEIDGLRVTSPERTCVDVMRADASDRAAIVLDSALRTGVAGLDGIAARLERLGGDVGVPQAWEHFRLADPRSEAATESKVRRILYRLGLYPRSQVVIVLADGRRYRVDFVVDGVIIECEGFAYHGGVEEHQADVRRFNELLVAATGHTAMRITWRDAFLDEERTERAILATVAAHKRRRAG